MIEDALRTLKIEYKYEVLAAVFIGGTEKILLDKDFHTLGIPVVVQPKAIEGIKKALAEYSPDLVIDLSDEPVVGYRERMQIASHVLSHGASYAGADFEFKAPPFHNVVEKPSVSLIGTGKRVGKTAISAYFARELKQAGLRPVIVAMGRGGPREPEVIKGEKALTPEYLLGISRQGKHAASDAYEDALMSRITTVACRRCGGGLAGAPFMSNVLLGAEVANQLSEEFVVFEGSGAALPPVKTDACILTVGANQPVEYIDGYFGTYRILLSDLVVFTMCEQPLADVAKRKVLCEAVERVKPGIDMIETVFRPVPLEPVEGKKVFFASTGPVEINEKIKDYLENEFRCEVVAISNSLANRRILLEDFKAAQGRFDLLLTELKAASVDVATKVGLDLGVKVVYCDNVPVTVNAEDNLAQTMLDLARKAKEQYGREDIKGE